MFFQNPYYFNNHHNDFYDKRPYHGGFFPGRACHCRSGFCRCDFGRKRFHRDYWGGFGY